MKGAVVQTIGGLSESKTTPACFKCRRAAKLLKKKDEIGDIKRIKFQPSATLNAHTFSDPSFNKAANGQSCSIIWDNKYEKWRILNCNNVEIFS